MMATKTEQFVMRMTPAGEQILRILAGLESGGDRTGYIGRLIARAAEAKIAEVLGNEQHPAHTALAVAAIQPWNDGTPAAQAKLLGVIVEAMTGADKVRDLWRREQARKEFLDKPGMLRVQRQAMLQGTVVIKMTESLHNEFMELEAGLLYAFSKELADLLIADGLAEIPSELAEQPVGDQN